MTPYRITVVIATAFVLSATMGCRKVGRPLALPNTPALPKDVPQWSAPAYLYSLEDYKRDVGVYYDTAKDEKTRSAARNSIAWGLMGAIDDVYSVYSAHLFEGKGAVAAIGDVASLGLTAAVSIARQNAAKTLFGALGTAITGVNLSVDKNFFAQQTYQAIALAMETRRTTIYAEISDSLANKTTVDYPLSAVKRDLILYLNAGSLPGALQELQKEAGAASQEINSKTKPAGAPSAPKNLAINLLPSDGNGQGTVAPVKPGGPYAAGTVVTLTAKAQDGSVFAGWSGGACSGMENPCTLTMDADKTVKATFNLK
ncbi:MAG: InlB B-repeat-containing protein [Bryobacteraceae bacterium]